MFALLIDARKQRPNLTHPWVIALSIPFAPRNLVLQAHAESVLTTKAVQQKAAEAQAESAEQAAVAAETAYATTLRAGAGSAEPATAVGRGANGGGGAGLHKHLQKRVAEQAREISRCMLLIEEAMHAKAASETRMAQGRVVS